MQAAIPVDHLTRRGVALTGWDHLDHISAVLPTGRYCDSRDSSDAQPGAEITTAVTIPAVSAAHPTGITLAILIPAYNEGRRLDNTLEAIAGSLLRLKNKASLPLEMTAIVVVDDGSDAPIQLRAREKRDNPQVWLLRHSVNLGQGAVLCTAIAFARDQLRARLFVTMDADGQHDPEDLPSLLHALIDHDADIAFGNRFAGNTHQMPTSRRILLKAATAFERAISGLNLSDAHNGYRAFSIRAAMLMDLQQNRMAHATEIKQIVRRHNLRYCEVPVSIDYSSETLEKGQRASGSLVILRDLLSAYLFRV
jgi:glycosyltransferase involved in cell wall biosynthesis